MITRAGGALAPSAWAFSRRGLLEFVVPADEEARDALMEAAIEAGAEDIEEGAKGSSADAEDGGARVHVLTAPSALHGVGAALAAKGFPAEAERLVYDVASDQRLELDDEAYDAAMAAVESLVALDDVEDVWHNLK